VCASRAPRCRPPIHARPAGRCPKRPVGVVRPGWRRSRDREHDRGRPQRAESWMLRPLDGSGPSRHGASMSMRHRPIRHCDVLTVMRGERGEGWSMADYRAGHPRHAQGFTWTYGQPMTQVGSTARRLSTPRPAQIAQSSMSDPEHVESVASPRPRSSHLIVDESSQGRPRRREGVGRNPGQPESVGRGRAPTVRPRCQQSGRGLHGRPACRRTDQQPTRAKSQAA